MTSPSSHPHRLVALLALVAAVTGSVCVRAAQPFVVVRVYDLALESAARRAAVISTAAAIIDDAGIRARWVACDAAPARRDETCRTPVRQGDLIVRILRDGSLPEHDGQCPLGYAVVDVHAHAGALATVFADRVWRMGEESRADVDVLLGRAVAHEVGHLLLRSDAHSPSGLMRGLWTDGEVFRNRPEDWVFSPLDRARLQQATEHVADVATN